MRQREEVQALLRKYQNEVLGISNGPWPLEDLGLAKTERAEPAARYKRSLYQCALSLAGGSRRDEGLLDRGLLRAVSGRRANILEGVILRQLPVGHHFMAFQALHCVLQVPPKFFGR